MSTKTIVLAEDDEKQRRLFTDFLGANGFDVLACANGLEALSLLHQVQPNLVLLDIIMPDLNGIETCRRARALIDHDTPIVFLSSLDYIDYVRKGIQAGGDDYIIKTSPLDEILERVNYWTSSLARRKSGQQRNTHLAE